MLIVALFVMLIVLVIVGVPIIFCIGLAALLGILAMPDLPTVVYAQRMFTMLDSYSLTAIPFFVLAGELMSDGGISKRLVEFAEACVGHMRSGLGMVSVVSSEVFSGVSGSAVADTSAIGSIIIPAMKEKGYKPGYAAAMLSCSGTIGPLIPPSMNFIIYGSMAGVSIAGLFMSGIIPGLLVGLSLMVTMYIHSFLPKYPELAVVTGKFSWSNLWHKAIKAWSSLLAPVIILGGILFSVFTATEAGAIAAIYSFVISYFFYKTIKLSDLPKIFLDTAITTGVVLGILATAGAFSWLLAYLDFNEAVFSLLTSVSTNPTVVILVLLGVVLLLTMFVECLAVLILLMPVFTYVCAQFGFDPVYFGCLMIFAIQIGAATPPVGVLLYVTTGLAGNTFDDTCKYLPPFLLATMIVLLLCVFFPALTTWIPNTFLGH